MDDKTRRLLLRRKLYKDLENLSKKFPDAVTDFERERAEINAQIQATYKSDESDVMNLESIHPAEEDEYDMQKSDTYYDEEAH